MIRQLIWHTVYIVYNLMKTWHFKVSLMREQKQLGSFLIFKHVYRLKGSYTEQPDEFTQSAFEYGEHKGFHYQNCECLSKKDQ